MATIERIERRDSKTGTRILQLTSFPVTHYHQYIYGQWISPDCETLLLFGYRENKRGAPSDLWRVKSDGSDLELVAEGAGWAMISMDGKWVYTGRGSSIVRIPLSGGGAEEELYRSDEFSGISVGAGSLDGRYLFCHSFRKGGDKGHALVRFDVKTGQAKKLFETSSLMHVQLHYPDRLLASVVPPEREYGIYTWNFEGEDFRKLPFTRSTNHYASLGHTGKVITTVHGQGKTIEVARPGDKEATTLTQGDGFWHPSSDASGEWIASDTNWPDTGLMLVHAPSGRYRPLCFTGASNGHPQWTHAHPRIAPDAGYVVFDSDATGICQVYLAFIPNEFKEELRTGG